jgi:hypothetical protein
MASAMAVTLVPRPVETALVFPSGRIEFRIQRKLRSPNELLGRHWREKSRERKLWQASMENALIDAIGVTRAQALLAPGAALVGCHGMCTTRRQVEVTRFAPRPRNFLRDDDNLRFAAKSLVDALKHLGLIRDDHRKWCELAIPTQAVSDDGAFWTWVVVDAVEGRV